MESPQPTQSDRFWVRMTGAIARHGVRIEPGEEIELGVAEAHALVHRHKAEFIAGPSDGAVGDGCEKNVALLTDEAIRARSLDEHTAAVAAEEGIPHAE